ncbi:hypothetical protein B4117_1029 [Bacillus mycoides]|nr:hypothetical protein B4117_1029 [Bacillus mycoides]
MKKARATALAFFVWKNVVHRFVHISHIVKRMKYLWAREGVFVQWGRFQVIQSGHCMTSMW